MKKFICIAFIAVVGLAVYFAAQSHSLQKRIAELEEFGCPPALTEEQMNEPVHEWKDGDTIVIIEKSKIAELEEQRDAARQSFYVERDAVVEYRKAIDGWIEENKSVTEKLERAKIDRDNNRNELSESRAECRRTAEELGKVLDCIDKKDAVIEAKDDVIRRLDGEVNCLREELKRAQSCVKCHQSHRVEQKQRRRR